MKNSVYSILYENKAGLSVGKQNRRVPDVMKADSLLVAQRRQPEAIYGLHYQPHRCEPIREPLRCAGSADLKNKSNPKNKECGAARNGAKELANYLVWQNRQ